MKLQAKEQVLFNHESEEGSYGMGHIEQGEVIEVDNQKYDKYMEQLKSDPENKGGNIMQIAQCLYGEFERLGLDGYREYASDSYINIQDLKKFSVIE